MTRPSRTTAVAIGAIAALGLSAATAGAAGRQTSTGNVTAGGIKVKWSATRPADAPATKATGTFVAEGAPVAAMGLPASVGSIRLSGPITCMQTRGEDVSFYYEFDDKSTSGVLGALKSGMIVSMRKSSADQYHMGFTPMMTSFVPMLGCDSSVTPLAVTSGGWQNGN